MKETSEKSKPKRGDSVELCLKVVDFAVEPLNLRGEVLGVDRDDLVQIKVPAMTLEVHLEELVRPDDDDQDDGEADDPDAPRSWTIPTQD
jgi:hypothetical protein